MVKRRTETKIPKHATGPRPGTLNLLILKAVSLGSTHGFGVLLRIERDLSRGALAIEQGALYPALDRLLRRRVLEGQWRQSENNRKARYYTLTPAGREMLKKEEAFWARTVEIMGAALACSHVAPVAPQGGKAARKTAKKSKGKTKAKSNAKAKTKAKARARKHKKAKTPKPAKKSSKDAHPVTAASALQDFHLHPSGPDTQDERESFGAVADATEGDAADEAEGEESL